MILLGLEIRWKIWKKATSKHLSKSLITKLNAWSVDIIFLDKDLIAIFHEITDVEGAEESSRHIKEISIKYRKNRLLTLTNISRNYIMLTVVNKKEKYHDFKSFRGIFKEYVYFKTTK